MNNHHHNNNDDATIRFVDVDSFCYYSEIVAVALMNDVVVISKIMMLMNDIVVLVVVTISVGVVVGPSSLYLW
jgi:hypothetical protein